MIPPQTLLQDRYLVLKQIGQGGMGTVYVATDQRFGSTVALKETLFADPSLRKAFEREAHLLHRLRHPALPRVSDHFTEGEGQFLVMEYVPGDDLAEMLKGRGSAFPLNEVLNWADGLLDALDYLHTQEEQPIIHRDIKPQNLKLMSRGQIILLDFGLAKGTPLHVTKATATGSVFGYSRNYAPLEQIQGTGTDPRSDLYSLGATLYHLMTGVVPPDALTRATAVLNGHPDPLRPANEVNPQVLTPVAAVLSSALAQNAGQRPPTAEAMRRALRDVHQQVAAEVGGAAVQPSPAASAFSEQETQLMNTRATTAAVSASNNSAPPSAAIEHSPTDSVATRFKALEPSDSKRSPRGRVLGVAAGVVILVMAAAVIYALTRNSASLATPSEQAIPQTSNSNSQPAVAPAVVEERKETQLPAPAASPLVTRRADASPKRSAARNATPKPAVEDERVRSDARENDDALESPEQNTPVPPIVPGRVRPVDATLDQQEIERRAVQKRNLMILRRRIIEEQRRRERMRQPTQTPPPRFDYYMDRDRRRRGQTQRP